MPYEPTEHDLLLDRENRARTNAVALWLLKATLPAMALAGYVALAETGLISAIIRKLEDSLTIRAQLLLAFTISALWMGWCAWNLCPRDKEQSVAAHSFEIMGCMFLLGVLNIFAAFVLAGCAIISLQIIQS